MTTESDDLKAFLQAAQAGDLATLRNFLDSGIDINYKAPWPDGNGVNDNGAPAIVRASMYGHLSAVKLLIDRGADIDNRNEYPLCGVSALLTASIRGDVEIVKLLVARGAKAESGSFEGTTTPLAACAGEQVTEFTEKRMEIVKLLLDNGHDVEACNEHGARPLMSAAHHGREDLVKLLLDRGASVNARDDPEHNGTSALDEAAYDGCLHLVRLLLDRGAEIKHPKRGFTALHKAAGWGRVEVMKLLLERGAHVEAFETRSTTALHEAGTTSSISFLLSQGFNIEARSSTKGNTPLLEAAHDGSTRAVELLLNSGADINARNDKGETALHLATFHLNAQDRATWGTSRYPRLELIKLLLSRGADFTIVDHDGQSLLQKVVQGFDPPDRPTDPRGLAAPRASLRGDIDAIELLISLGANVGVRDYQGETVLHRAAHEWNPEMIRMLLNAGADVEAEKSDGSTPLFELVASGPHYRCVWWTTAPTMKVLLDAGANINARRNDGRTVLHELVVMVRTQSDEEGSEVLALLLDRGVDTEVRDSNGETALQLAERLERTFMVELLRDRPHHQ